MLQLHFIQTASAQAVAASIPAIDMNDLVRVVGTTSALADAHAKLGKMVGFWSRLLPTHAVGPICYPQGLLLSSSIVVVAWGQRHDYFASIFDPSAVLAITGASTSNGFSHRAPMPPSKPSGYQKDRGNGDGLASRINAADDERAKPKRYGTGPSITYNEED